MKNFLRYTAILFLLVLVFVIIRSLVVKETTDIPSDIKTEEEISETQALDISNTSEEQNLEDLIDPNENEEGIIILGGDGIPNN